MKDLEYIFAIILFLVELFLANLLIAYLGIDKFSWGGYIIFIICFTLMSFTWTELPKKFKKKAMPEKELTKVSNPSEFEDKSRKE